MKSRHPLLRYAGMSLNGYHLERFLNAGAFGAVFKAKKNHKTYAVKLFDISITGGKKDMEDEVKAFNAISKDPQCQQYIVCMYDHFTISYLDLGAVVLEFMDGGDLDDLIEYNRRGVSSLTLVTIMKDLLTALAFIHSHGMAHQDIKPGNALSSSNHKVFKLADLGGACGGQLHACKSWGTPAYLAPELARKVYNNQGRFDELISTREAQMADIWSLGTVFWTMAYGYMQFPFSMGKVLKIADIINVLRRIRLQSQVKVSRYRADAGNVGYATINKIINLMLRVDPTQRPTASDLRDLLDQEIAGCSISPTKNYSRRQLSRLLRTDTRMRTFFEENNYSPNMMMGQLCRIYKRYLQKINPPPTPMEVENVGHRAEEPMKVENIGYQPPLIETGAHLKRSVFKPLIPQIQAPTGRIPIQPRKRKTRSKNIFARLAGGAPFEIPPEMKRPQKRLKGKEKVTPPQEEAPEEVTKPTRQKSPIAPPPPRTQTEKPTPQFGKNFTCFAGGQRSQENLDAISKQFNIPTKGKSNLELCEEVYSRLWEENKLNRLKVAKDIFAGLALATKSDIMDGITGTNLDEYSDVSQDQRSMIEAIATIIQEGGKDVVDYRFLLDKMESLRKDVVRLQGKNILTKAEKIRKEFDLRLMAYIKHTLEYLNMVFLRQSI